MDTPTSWKPISVGRTAEGETRELYVCSACPMRCKLSFKLDDEPPALCDHAVVDELSPAESAVVTPT